MEKTLSNVQNVSSATTTEARSRFKGRNIAIDDYDDYIDHDDDSGDADRRKPSFNF